MLEIVQTIPYTIGHVWYVDSWSKTADAIRYTWMGVGVIDCYGNTHFVNNEADLLRVVEIIGSCTDFGV